MTYEDFEKYLHAVESQYMSKANVLKLLYNLAGGYDYIECVVRYACEKVRRAPAIMIDYRRGEDDEDS